MAVTQWPCQVIKCAALDHPREGKVDPESYTYTTGKHIHCRRREPDSSSFHISTKEDSPEKKTPARNFLLLDMEQYFAVLCMFFLLHPLPIPYISTRSTTQKVRIARIKKIY
jgi:hypothetical protein